MRVCKENMFSKCEYGNGHVELDGKEGSIGAR